MRVVIITLKKSQLETLVQTYANTDHNIDVDAEFRYGVYEVRLDGKAKNLIAFINAVVGEFILKGYDSTQLLWAINELLKGGENE